MDWALFEKIHENKYLMLTHCWMKIHMCPKWEDLVASLKLQEKNGSSHRKKRANNDGSQTLLVDEDGAMDWEKRVIQSRIRNFEKEATNDERGNLINLSAR